nr:hypothetical protein [Zobellia laminariae]
MGLRISSERVSSYFSMVLAESYSLLTENCIGLNKLVPVTVVIYGNPHKKDEFNIQFCKVDVNFKIEKQQSEQFW